MSSPRLSLVLALTLAFACNGKRTPGNVHREPGELPPGSRPGSDTAGTQASKQADNPARTAGADQASARTLAAAAQALLAAAGAARGRLALGFDSGDREEWHYVPRSRKGLALGDMTAAVRDATHALLRAGLSERGYEKVEGILVIEGILGQIEGNPGFRDPDRYHVAIFGQPGTDSPWGWRFEGHHLSLNFTQVGGQVATTPAFLGANPARVSTGPHQGLRVLGAEEDLGRALLASLTDEQRGRAIIASSAPSDIVTEASRRVTLARFEGLPAADMSADQRAALMRLIEAYVHDFQPDLARAHLDRIERAGVDRLHFAWAGSAEPRRAHYYRIHGPTHLIEYDNRGGNHIHTVFRDLENDFGDSLLARHLHEHHGSKAHK